MNQLPDPQPTTGRIVHFYLNDDMCVSPATVLATYRDVNSEVWPDDLAERPERVKGTVSLLVHGLVRDYRVHGVPYSADPQAGCWTWPPRT